MIPAIITALVPALGTLVDRLIPDKAAAERAKADMEAALVKAANEAAMAQGEVNKIEAGHSSVFVAGWRPFIGWVCGAALAWAFIVGPVLSWALAVLGIRESLPPIMAGLVAYYFGSSAGSARKSDTLDRLTGGKP